MILNIHICIHDIYYTRNDSHQNRRLIFQDYHLPIPLQRVIQGVSQIIFQTVASFHVRQHLVQPDFFNLASPQVIKKFAQAPDFTAVNKYFM